MVKEQELTELVDRLKSAAGENLCAVVLYGSAAKQESHTEFSDLNLMCILRELAPATMGVLTPALRWWTAKGHAAPLFFSRQEVANAADVFSIEMLDIKQRHRILFGEDLFATLHISMERHRIQLEHELRTKLLFLRQHYLLNSDDDSKIVGLMLEAVPNFASLFRHVLIAMGEEPPAHKLQITERLGQKLGFDARPFVALLQVRERKLKPSDIDAKRTFSGLIQGIETVIHAVDAL